MADHRYTKGRTTKIAEGAFFIDPSLDYTDGYRVTVGWSDEDEAWIAQVSGCVGDTACLAHGPTKESALLNLACAMAATLDAVSEPATPTPPSERCGDIGIGLTMGGTPPSASGFCSTCGAPEEDGLICHKSWCARTREPPSASVEEARRKLGHHLILSDEAGEAVNALIQSVRSDEQAKRGTLTLAQLEAVADAAGKAVRSGVASEQAKRPTVSREAVEWLRGWITYFSDHGCFDDAQRARELLAAVEGK
jgi:hypothetical protein